jgi:hypothetical protein
MSSSSGSDRSGVVKTGLRRRVASNKVKTSSASKVSAYTRICGSPLDKFCESLLCWNILDKFTTTASTVEPVAKKISKDDVKASDDVEEVNRDANKKLKDHYSSYDEYLLVYDSIILEEIRAGVVSTISNKASKLRKEVVFCSNFDTITANSGNLVQLNCTLDSSSNHTKKDHSKGGFGSGSGIGIGSMDLVLLSKQHIPNLVNFDANTIHKEDCMLALVTSTHRGIQLKVFNSSWDCIKSTISSTERSLVRLNNKQEREQKKVIAEFHNSTIEKEMASVASQPTNRNGKRGITQISTDAVSFGTTAKSNSKQIGSGTGNILKLNGQTMFRLHCTVLDSLISPWREYLAVHELEQAPLFKSVLAPHQNNYIDLPDTPPNASDKHLSFEGFPESGSMSTSLQQSDIDVEEVQSSLFSFQPLEAVDNEKVTTDIETNITNKISLPGLPESFASILRLQLNKSQQIAVRSAYTNDGFVLVQGPPGTGKTSTVVAILNCIHFIEYQEYYKKCVNTVLTLDNMKVRNPKNHPKPWLDIIAQLNKLKPHILVTAPSNVAVDNIIERIMDKGFIDGTGRPYNPNMLRIGRGGSPKIASVSMEEIAEQEQLTSLDESMRLQAIHDVERNMIDIVFQLQHSQMLLITLASTFKAYPLPEGWELRVNMETGQPYWVNHNRQCVSCSPPTEYDLQDPSNENSDEIQIKSENIIVSDPTKWKLSGCTIDTIPEYQAFSYKLTQELEELERLHLFNNRCKARLDPVRHGGVSAVKNVVETSIIDGAHLVFTTLNGAGHPCLESTRFKIAVIDEAGQCVEPSTLIALRRGCERCVMVGDPAQLPATIFSNEAKAIGYDRSMFERLVATGHQVIMLNTQYRMAPEISKFPSKMFYNGKLKDGKSVVDNSKVPSYIKVTSKSNVVPLHGVTLENGGKVEQSDLMTPLLEHLMFFDVKSEESQGKMSRSNTQEVHMCVKLLRLLVAEAYKFNNGSLGSIGIITPYAEQLLALKKSFQMNSIVTGMELSNLLDPRMRDNIPQNQCIGNCLDIELNTVDGFQGREKDIILISCVRANDQGSIGFLSDKRRMNVALTRAKYGMFVIGNSLTLKGNEMWKKFIEHTEEQKVLYSFENIQQLNLGKEIKDQQCKRN